MGSERRDRSGRRALDRRASDRRALQRREQNMWVSSDRRSGLDRRSLERRGFNDRRVVPDRRRADR